MLSVVAELQPSESWIQVLGRIAIHPHDGDTRSLTGSGQRLLSVLVACGPDGASAERISEEIWGDTQPDPWRPALRMAVARLRKLLPGDWDVVSSAGMYRITTGGGWVDAWRLAEVANSSEPLNENDLAWMLAGTPFLDIDLLEIIRAGTQQLQMLQIAIAERFCAQAHTTLSAATTGLLTGLLHEHPYNDRLAHAIGKCFVDAGRSTEALAALSAFAEIYASEFGSVPSQLGQFLSSRRGTEPVPVAGTGETLRAATPAVQAGIPKELRHLLETPMRGRAESFTLLAESSSALVTGPIGSGKTRLLAELVAADLRIETTYVVGDDRLELPLGPFAVAMPSIRDELVAEQFDGIGTQDGASADRSASSRGWRIVLAHLEAASMAAPQRLVVDDAHLLDPASLNLLRLLVRSKTAADVSIVIAGRSGFDSDEWANFAADAERAGLAPVALEGLPIAVVEEMVFDQIPDATSEARRGLAREIRVASAGLPAVIAPLIAAADPTTLALPEQLRDTSVLARATDRVANPRVVAAAAVLGLQFSVGALIALAEIDEAEVFDVLDELWVAGIIVETDDPDQVRFRHVLIQQAFLDDIPRFRRGQLHRRAAELTDDIHERASHLADAGGLTAAGETVAALRESATLYAKGRQWRRVVDELRRASEIPDAALDAGALTLWAAALDRSGRDGGDLRKQAFAAAIAGKDPAGALAAALSGLPEAELPDGDVDRIAMLEQVDEAALPVDRRFHRAFHLSRQCALAGRNEDALRHADRALELADDPDEVGMGHVSQWTATRHVHPEPHEFPPEIMHQGSLQVRVRLAQMNAISQAERGDFEAARREAARFDQLASDVGDPLRIWQSIGLRSMFSLNDGNIDEAEMLAGQALALAGLHSIQQGTAAYIAQRSHSFNIQGRLVELAPTLQPFRVNMSMTTLGRSVLVACDAATGSEAVGPEVHALATGALDRPNASSPLVLTSLASLITDYAPELVERVRAFLVPFGDRPLLAGFGGGNLGPTCRYVAQLASDHTERVELTERSIRAADQHGPLLWRVHTRLDLAHLGDADAHHQAEALAANTGLAAVVERLGPDQ